MKVLVCGGRDYTDLDRVYAVLDKLHDEAGVDVVVHGDASGADSLAKRWAEETGVSQRGYPADWEAQGSFAGPARNQRMLDEEQPDLVIAFPGNKGTRDMIRRARRAGVEVVEISR